MRLVDGTAMSAEEIIASALESQVSRLSMGSRHLLMLDQPVMDRVRHVLRPGPHVAGWLERPTPDQLRIRLLPIEAGRTARALLEDELLDVVPSREHPPANQTHSKRGGIRLRWT
jgi:hypothetical protein